MSEDLSTRDDGRTEMTITVPADEVEAALDAAYKKLIRGVTIPGFRKGRAPRAIFERHYGSAPLYEEALPEILPRAFERAAVEAGADPIGSPDYDVKELAADSPLVFSVAFETRPVAEAGDYGSITVPFELPPVTDEEVDERIQAARKRVAELVPVEDEGVKLTDQHAAVVDMSTTVEGRETEEAQEVLVDLGGDVIPEFRDNLVGNSAGSVVEFTVRFPEDRGDDLAGKEAAFRVLVKEIKARQLPELDDEFARQYAGVDTVDEMRVSIRESIQRSRTVNAVSECERKVLDELAAMVQLDDIPQSLVQEEGERLARNFRGLDLSGLSDEAAQRFAESLKEPATARVKEKLALEAVARAEGMVVEDDDWTTATEEVLQGFESGRRDKVRQDLSSGFARKALERDILRTRALKLVAERAAAGYAEARRSLEDTGAGTGE